MARTGREGREAARAPSPHADGRQPAATAAAPGTLPASIDASPRMAAQRARLGALVAQRVGKVLPDFMDGAVKLYVPEAPTVCAAYYAHGVYKGQTPPVDNVSLGYLAPHQSTTSTNPEAVGLSPNRAAEIDAKGHWHDYILTRESQASDEQVWLGLAESSKRAIAWVQAPTSTAKIVAALAQAGYTDLLAVHCREVFNDTNLDWDPLTNSEVVHDQKGWMVERASMATWLDGELEALGTDREVFVGNLFYSQEKRKSFRVLKIGTGEQEGMVKICEFIP